MYQDLCVVDRATQDYLIARQWRSVLGRSDPVNDEGTRLETSPQRSRVEADFEGWDIRERSAKIYWQVSCVPDAGVPGNAQPGEGHRARRRQTGAVHVGGVIWSDGMTGK